jgi:hypothetical protein
VKNLLGLFLSALALFIAGCGSSGSSSPGGTTVSGVVSTAPVTGATVTAFEVISSATTNPRPNIPRLGTTSLGTGATTNGSFSLRLPTSFKRGSIYLQASGGTYTDEATNASTSLNSQFANGLHAIFGNISGAVRRGQQITVSVTPFTEMAFQDATVANTPPTDGQIATSNLNINNAFFGQNTVASATLNLSISKAFEQNTSGVNIISTEPLNPFVAPPSSATNAQEAYTVALAALSQYAANNGGNLGTSTAALLAQLQANEYTLQVATSTALTAATFAVFNNNTNLNSVIKNNPAANPTAPATFTVTPTATTGAAINTGSVPVTATVLTESGSAVPDDTVVSFATTVGTLSAKTATTVSGVASVTLTSSTVGSGAVTATAGAQTAATGTITFSDPNAPGAITLTSSSATSSTSTGVTLTATVTPVSNTGTLANGTTVTFKTTSGTGGTLSAVTTTTGGVATATLSDATAEIVTVTASVTGNAGTFTSSPQSVNFITQPTQAIVKVQTSGTPLASGTTIGGITAEVDYPTTGLSIASSNVSNTGAGAASGSLLTPNASTPGMVILGFINASGIQLGEFATLNFQVAAGTFPTAANFTIYSGTNSGSHKAIAVVDQNGNPVPGVTVTIESVTVQ